MSTALVVHHALITLALPVEEWSGGGEHHLPDKTLGIDCLSVLNSEGIFPWLSVLIMLLFIFVFIRVHNTDNQGRVDLHRGKHLG